MGSIVEGKRLDKKTGKAVIQYRAHVRRTGFKSKSKVFTSKREALDWLRNNEADTALEKATEGRGATFKRLIEDFTAAGNCKYATFAHLDFWLEQFSALKVGEITRRDINGAKLTLQNRPAMHRTIDGAKPTKNKLTPATINRYLATLSAVFNFALEHELIEEHPMRGGKVKKLKESNGRTRILNAEEEARLMAAAAASEWSLLFLFVRMLLTTSARKSEVLKLRWNDVKLGDSVAIVTETKNGRARALPLVSEVKALLEKAKKVRPLRSDFVFYDPRNPEQVKNIDTVWIACRKAAGVYQDREDKLDRVVLHTTRHTAVTKLLKGGANTAQAAVVSGHRTLAMLKRYEHLAAQDAVDIAEKLLGGTDSKTAA
jgi:integrase